MVARRYDPLTRVIATWYPELATTIGDVLASGEAPKSMVRKPPTRTMETKEFPPTEVTADAVGDDADAAGSAPPSQRNHTAKVY
jgi:hypothetical protein